mgnify:CR=1 FL=1
MNARLLALLPAAIAINLVIGGLVNALGLPLYLDSIGTILATVLAGPAAGLGTVCSEVTSNFPLPQLTVVSWSF